MKRSLLWKAAAMWGKGVSCICRVYLLAIVPIYLASDTLKHPSSISALYFGICGVLFILGVILVPLCISLYTLDPRLHREQVSAIEANINETGARLGVNWEGNYLLDVDNLMNQGLKDQARKLYHEHAGGTWDEAYFALLNWPHTILIKKLELIEAQCTHIAGHCESTIASHA